MKLILISILLFLILLILLIKNKKQTNKLINNTSGKVIYGHQLGKNIFDYPTANIKNNINLPEGIYIANTNYGDGICMVFNKYIIEIHIKNFNKNIYGKIIKLTNIKNLKDSNNIHKLLKKARIITKHNL